MLDLLHRARRIRKVVRAPEHARAHGGVLPIRVFRVPHILRITRLVNNPVDALLAHPDKIRAHLVVVRKIDDAIARERANLQCLQTQQSETEGEFHAQTITTPGG